MQFTDTHCHIHESGVAEAGDDATRQRWEKLGNLPPQELSTRAQAQGVQTLLCVGCSLDDSQRAVTFAQQQSGVWAAIGLHPHEAKRYANDQVALQEFATLATESKVVAIGECGLDYFYHKRPAPEQEKILRFQITLALQHNLPMVFHIREAFEDFWPIFDSYTGIRGVVHSFSATPKDLAEILKRNLYVGLNGIMTFTKDTTQLAAAKAVPIDRLLLETDAPFLTPEPYRGTICEPKHVRNVAEFLATLRDEPLEAVAEATTRNAQTLFDFKEVA